MEISVEAKVFLVHMQCEKCKEGFMLDETNDDNLHIALMSNPPKFPHKCNKCGHVENYTINYPYQTLVPVNEL